MTKTRYALEIKHYPASRKSFEVDGIEKDLLELDDVAKTATLIIGPGRTAVANTAGDLVYTDAPLLNGWLDFGSTWAKVAFAKDAQGVVHLKGLARSGVTASGTIIFPLPVGYRPGESRICLAYCSNGVTQRECRIDIHPDGDVQVGGQGSTVDNSWLSLEGISFVAA